MANRDQDGNERRWRIHELGLQAVVPALALLALVWSAANTFNDAHEAKLRITAIEQQNLPTRLSVVEGRMQQMQDTETKLAELLGSINEHIASLDERTKILVDQTMGEPRRRK